MVVAASVDVILQDQFIMVLTGMVDSIEVARLEIRIELDLVCLTICCWFGYSLYHFGFAIYAFQVDNGCSKVTLIEIQKFLVDWHLVGIPIE